MLDAVDEKQSARMDDSEATRGSVHARGASQSRLARSTLRAPPQRLWDGRTRHARRHRLRLPQGRLAFLQMQVLDDRVAKLEEENAASQQKLADMEAVAKAHAEESARIKLELQHERRLTLYEQLARSSEVRMNRGEILPLSHEPHRSPAAWG